MRTEIVAGGCSRGLCVSGHVDEVVIITSRPRWKAQENLIFPEERTTTGPPRPGMVWVHQGISDPGVAECAGAPTIINRVL